MPAFYLLAIIALVLLWFGLAFAFKSVGKFSIKFFGDAIDIINERDEEEERED